MTTPNDPTQGASGSLGFTTRTDVAGNTGTQADANPTDAPVPQSDPNATQNVSAEARTAADTARGDAKPGEALGDNAPNLDTLQHQSCPNCTTGVLYVTRYDPEALHERDQGAALRAGHESGGAYDVECRACGFTDSRAFNPGKLWGR